MNEELIKRVGNLLTASRTGRWKNDAESAMKDCRAEILRLEAEREYVPMTEDELALLFQGFLCADVMDSGYPKIKYVEAEVIKRAGLRIRGEE